MNTDKYKKILEEELEKVAEELKSIGRINPDNPKDWEPIPENMDITKADDNETADTIEAYEENTAVLKQLEIRYNNIKQALERIESNTYGKCVVCGNLIENDRLDANPSATTCKKDM